MKDSQKIDEIVTIKPQPGTKGHIEIPNVSVEDLRERYSSEIKEMLENLNLDLKGFSKIVISNVEVEMNDYKDDLPDYEDMNE